MRCAPRTFPANRLFTQPDDHGAGCHLPCAPSPPHGGEADEGLGETENLAEGDAFPAGEELKPAVENLEPVVVEKSVEQDVDLKDDDLKYDDLKDDDLKDDELKDDDDDDVKPESVDAPGDLIGV
jgi:hypothetical protein